LEEGIILKLERRTFLEGKKRKNLRHGGTQHLLGRMGQGFFYWGGSFTKEREGFGNKHIFGVFSGEN